MTEAAESSEEGYRAAVVDLLGLLAYAQLVAFERLAYDARFAPSLTAKAALAKMAATEFAHHELVAARLAEMGVVTADAMAPFVRPLDTYHAQTAPGTWAESVVKAYVGDGIARDFYREIASLLAPRTRDLVFEVLADTGYAKFAVTQVRAAIAEDPTLAGRLALWGRRLVGEALSQAQRVAAERDALVALLVGGGTPVGEGQPDRDLSGIFGRLIDAHRARMAEMGLSA